MLIPKCGKVSSSSSEITRIAIKKTWYSLVTACIAIKIRGAHLRCLNANLWLNVREWVEVIENKDGILSFTSFLRIVSIRGKKT